MSTLFISDLHLEDSQPDDHGWLLDFLTGPASEAEALYILGDLFEFWIGDDAFPPRPGEVAGALAGWMPPACPAISCTATGISCWASATRPRPGMHLLPETLVVDLYGTPTLLLHGDSCARMISNTRPSGSSPQPCLAGRRARHVGRRASADGQEAHATPA